MKSIEAWLEEYGVSHQNPTNKLIHRICVPLIFFSIVGFFYAIKLPVEIAAGLPLNLAVPMVVAVTIYYFILSRTLALGMLLFSLVCVTGCYWIETIGANLWVICVAIFVLAWIGQFYGHKVEGKKPSFFKDLQYLMIGPAWLMSAVYQKLGISF